MLPVENETEKAQTQGQPGLPGSCHLETQATTRNFLAMIQYTLIYFSQSLPLPANSSWSTINSLPRQSLRSKESWLYAAFLFYLTYLCKHNGFRFHSAHKWRGILKGQVFIFIFPCDGVVISVCPFSVCCSYLSFPQLTESSLRNSVVNLDTKRPAEDHKLDPDCSTEDLTSKE